MSYNIAIVGATGNVGREILATLAERDFPVKEIHALASDRTSGTQVSFGDDKILKVQNLKEFDFKGIDIVLSSPGSKVSVEFAPIAARAGAVVIDNTSEFRMNPDVPLIVPEVNPEAMIDYPKLNIIANPNCTTIHRVVALKPLHDFAKIKRIIVSTYQSVSGAGKDAMDELFNQTKAIYTNAQLYKESFKKQIAFNVIPQIDSFMQDGHTKEEWKQVVETQKILDPSIKVISTCVRVPVFIGHAEAITIEFENPISVNKAKSLLKNAPGIQMIDETSEEEFITPIETAGEDFVFVSRIRQDPTVPHGLVLWIVADNLRKGAALNAVQIAEMLIKKYLK
ncbi:MAG: aspartate-semialdehyde dehydrogenase [Alphaproteobacteria bacterium]|nr:aspartate-semialdehyde dehydrogenase [Alphaproteobacteria bacterium]